MLRVGLILRVSGVQLEANKCNGKLNEKCEICDFRFFCFTNTIKLVPQPDYGDLFTIEEFKKHCEGGSFIDYDGSAYYATDKLMTRIAVTPSEIRNGKVDKRWSHIMWFNK